MKINNKQEFTQAEINTVKIFAPYCAGYVRQITNDEGLIYIDEDNSNPIDWLEYADGKEVEVLRKKIESMEDRNEILKKLGFCILPIAQNHEYQDYEE